MKGTVKIKGGVHLRGEVSPIPNKNSLMAALPAAMLSSEGVVYKNLPKTSDVNRILRIYEHLGAHIDYREDGSVLIDCRDCRSFKIDTPIASEFRGAFMFAGPLLARFGEAEVPLPGGCILGMRSVTTHLYGFRKLGISVQYRDGYVHLKAPKQNQGPCRIWQLEASVTATANLAMYAVGTTCEVEISDATCEPHTTDLLNLLVDMGANIEGIGSTRLVIKGNSELGSAEFESRPDYVDIAGYFVAAAVTDGEIRLRDTNQPDIVDGLIEWFSMFGLEIFRDNTDLIVRKGGKLTIEPDSGFPLAGKDLPKLAPRPWPGFPVDVLPVVATLASKAEGRLLLQNWMYESGFEFVRELNYLGGEIFVADPHRIIVLEPVVSFRGGEVAPPRVIQATKAIFLAALADPVETVIHGVDILKRRYPDIFEIYGSLGAEIEIL